MKIIFFGDVYGQPGRNALKKIIPKWQRKYQPDLVIANGENLAHGFGISKKGLDEILKAGVDIVTSGDHIADRKESKNLLENKDVPLLKPANLPKMPGQDYRLIEVGSQKVAIINLLGQVFMAKECGNPFKAADKIIEEIAEEAKIIIVDFHAEATSEKVCLGWYLDGRVSAVIGTHTHIPTADQRILPQGTAYVTDAGMVGPKDSSIGADKDIALRRFLGETKLDLKPAKGIAEVNAVLLIIKNDGKAKKIKRLQETIDLL
jgi:metallophosphoesterase (TIGR00282 family)